MPAVMTPDELKKKWLFGVSLCDDNGHEFPEEMFTQAIDNACELTAAELDLVLDATPRAVIDEKHDVRDIDAESFFLMHLFERPLRSIDEVRLQLGSFESITLPSGWLHSLDPLHGTMQILPGPEGITGVFTGLGNPYLLSAGGWRMFPMYFHVDYTVGYDVDGALPIPAAILNVIGLRAAIPILDIAGDLIVGAGIASQSVSMDGLSTSIGTTSSATNAGYGAKIISYGKQIEAAMQILNGKYGSSMDASVF